MIDIKLFNKQAVSFKKENETFLKKLKTKKNINLDNVFHKAHNAVFNNTDCLTCANCCKTTSPIFYQIDIERAAKALKIKPGDFIKQYLFMDEDGDFVLKSAPCPFLDDDNYCKIYKDRPTACKEYPHTNRKNIRQILNLTYNNTLVCPAVFNIVEKIKNEIKI